MSGTFGRARAISLIGVGVLLGAIMIAPAFGHHSPPHTKKQIKKLTKKVKNTYTKAQADAAFEPNGTIQTFGQVKMNAGAQDQVLATVGPFSWIAQCFTDGGGDLNAQILITTTEQNSFYAAGSGVGVGAVGSNTDLDPGDVDQVWAGGDFLAPPGAASWWHWDNQAIAGSPSGVMVSGISSIFTDVAGANCVFSGHITRTA